MGCGRWRSSTREEELLYDFCSGRLGVQPYGRKVDAARYWQWAGCKRMGYSIVSLAQGAFFQKTVLLVYAIFQSFEQRAVRIRLVFSPSQLLGAPSLGTLSLSLGGVQMREAAGAGIWAPFLAFVGIRSAVPTQWPWLLTA